MFSDKSETVDKLDAIISYHLSDNTGWSLGRREFVLSVRTSLENKIPTAS